MAESKDEVALVIENWLQTLGIQHLAEWDLLVYLYRHQPCLVNAEQISHLLDYGTNPIVDALNALESSGLIERSRAKQGVRLHRLIAPTEPACREAFEQLMSMDDPRLVRQLLARTRRNSHSAQWDARYEGRGEAG